MGEWEMGRRGDTVTRGKSSPWDERATNQPRAHLSRRSPKGERGSERVGAKRGGGGRYRAKGKHRSPIAIDFRRHRPFNEALKRGRLAQLARALARHARGHWFESSIAQLVTPARSLVRFTPPSRHPRKALSRCGNLASNAGGAHLN